MEIETFNLKNIKYMKFYKTIKAIFAHIKRDGKSGKIKCTQMHLVVINKSCLHVIGHGSQLEVAFCAIYIIGHITIRSLDRLLPRVTTPVLTICLE